LSALGDSAVVINFGREISTELNDLALAAAAAFEQNPFHGFVEAAPAYASITVFYDLIKVRIAYPEFVTAFDAVAEIIRSVLASIDASTERSQPVIEISVEFGGEDLPYVAEFAAATIEETIEIFLTRIYRVYMLGFLPGFAYMGDVDERIAAPRKSQPRLRVPKGSVGIANRQTGIYPFDSPGGWQLIGRTTVEMFRPKEQSICLLSPGDSVRFVRAN
ncbi:MAG: 5-oxoprolinase subunit PxpB, partial [Acidobacteria bacterium]|nr:5-oxoprolinase subunit PxpB [Acidobacteriota bacterium]